MVESGHSRKCDHTTDFRQFNGACDGRITVERHVRSVTIVVPDEFTYSSQQMTLAEHNEMVEQLPPQRPDKSFGVSVLPRRSRRGHELADPHVIDAGPERSTVDSIAVSDQTTDGCVEPDGLNDLLRGPRCIGVCGDVDV